MPGGSARRTQTGTEVMRVQQINPLLFFHQFADLCGGVWCKDQAIQLAFGESLVIERFLRCSAALPGEKRWERSGRRMRRLQGFLQVLGQDTVSLLLFSSNHSLNRLPDGRLIAGCRMTGQFQQHIRLAHVILSAVMSA